jgi:hypothetical protein
MHLAVDDSQRPAGPAVLHALDESAALMRKLEEEAARPQTAR